jgi:hypothetical protein
MSFVFLVISILLITSDLWRKANDPVSGKGRSESSLSPRKVSTFFCPAQRVFHRGALQGVESRSIAFGCSFFFSSTAIVAETRTTKEEGFKKPLLC